VIQPEYPTYHFAGRDEYCLSLGSGADRRILIVPPLFDEMNRMRHVLVSAMRNLAERGVGSMLIDLPGCNESNAQLAKQDLESWRGAVAACAAQLGATHSASLRGGALIDGVAHIPHWRLAAAKGASLLKIMVRTRIAGEKEAGRVLTEAALLAEPGPTELAGNMLGPTMIAQLGSAEPLAVRNLTQRTLGTEVAGSPLWLRAEPQDDPAFAAAIAEDLDRWSVSCGG
jgi:hypothetical protein